MGQDTKRSKKYRAEKFKSDRFRKGEPSFKAEMRELGKVIGTGCCKECFAVPILPFNDICKTCGCCSLCCKCKKISDMI